MTVPAEMGSSGEIGFDHALISNSEDFGFSGSCPFGSSDFVTVTI